MATTMQPSTRVRLLVGGTNIKPRRAIRGEGCISTIKPLAFRSRPEDREAIEKVKQHYRESFGVEPATSIVIVQGIEELVKQAAKGTLAQHRECYTRGDDPRSPDKRVASDKGEASDDEEGVAPPKPPRSRLWASKGPAFRKRMDELEAARKAGMEVPGGTNTVTLARELGMVKLTFRTWADQMYPETMRWIVEPLQEAPRAAERARMRAVVAELGLEEKAAKGAAAPTGGTFNALARRLGVAKGNVRRWMQADFPEVATWLTGQHFSRIGKTWQSFTSKGDALRARA